MSSSLTLYNSQGQPVEITGDSIQGSGIGSIEMYATMTAPVGYLVCPPAEAPDSAYPLKTAFPDLYAKVGDIWGVLTDTTRFKIPNSSKDGKGYFNRGTGNVGVGTQQDDATTAISIPAVADVLYSSSTTIVGKSNNTALGDSFTNADTTETRPMAQTMLMCIKAFHSVASTGDVDLQAIINSLPDTRSFATAWVIFDGTTTTPTISGSYNISSVVKISTSVYELTFTTPMDNVGYTISGSSRTGDDVGRGYSGTLSSHGTVYSTTTVRVTAQNNANSTQAGNIVDAKEVSVVIFGGKN